MKGVVGVGGDRRGERRQQLCWYVSDGAYGGGVMVARQSYPLPMQLLGLNVVVEIPE